ncbi:DNA pilot protein [Tortoise microvirus 14]|nr:DNA pilot protein [Tortoise microvirus 14]
MDWKGMGINMASDAARMAGGSIGNVIGQGLSRTFGLDSYQDKRQIEQQQRLTGIQINANKELGKYGQQLERELFDYTSEYMTPLNQRKRLEQAGMNPALLYGIGSGQGGTTGAATTSGAGGAPASDAASATHAQTARMGMALQLGMMKSQIALNEGLANKANADATITAGAHTDYLNQQITESNQRVQNMAAEIKNIAIRSEAMILQNEQQRIENRILTATEDEKISIAEESLQQLRKNNESLLETIKNQKLSNEEYRQIFNYRVQSAKNNIALIVAQTAEFSTRAGVNEQEKWAVGQRIAQKWADIVNDTRDVQTRQNALTNALYQERIKMSGNLIWHLSRGIDELPGGDPTKTTTTGKIP